MSIAIIVYQVVIAIVVIGGAVLKGRRGLNWVTAGAVIWTIFHIYAPWLMLIQFFTIAVAYSIGNAIASEE